MAVSASWPQLAQTGLTAAAEEFFRARAGMPPEESATLVPSASPAHSPSGPVIDSWDALRAWAPRRTTGDGRG